MAEWKIFVNDNLYQVAEFPDNYVEQDVLHYAMQYIDLWVEKVES